MAVPNSFYANALTLFATAQIDWVTDATKLVLVKTGGAPGVLYTPNLGTDTSLADVPLGSRIATSAAMTGKAGARGLLTADDVVFPFLVGPTVGALVVYKDTGIEATSPLILLFENAQNLPFVPYNNELTVQFPNGLGRLGLVA